MEKPSFALSVDVEDEAADVPCIFGMGRLRDLDVRTNVYACPSLKMLLSGLFGGAAGQANSNDRAQRQVRLQGGLQPAAARRWYARLPPILLKKSPDWAEAEAGPALRA